MRYYIKMTILAKNVFKFIFVGSILCATTFTYAETANNGCALKVQNIQKEIDYAKSYGNTHKVAGLETALANTKKYCTDTSLRKDLSSDIAKKQRKVDERIKDLKEAQLKGDADKIAKKQKKLTKAEEELKKAQDDLNTYFK